MAYIFLDESGNLGFDFKKKKTTKFFVITFLFVKNRNSLNKIVKKVFRDLTKQELKTIQAFFIVIKKNLKHG